MNNYPKTKIQKENIKVIEYLNQIYPLSDGLKEDLAARLVCIEVKKKETLLKTGKIANYIYFIEKGLFRSFYVKGGKEVNAWFMKENDVIISVYSFYKQVVSMETIVALEDAVLYYITYQELMDLYEKHLEFNIIGRILTTHYYIQSEERNHILRKENAEHRYNYFLENYSDLFQRITLYHIASYLGVSAETLSRIRRQANS